MHSELQEAIERSQANLYRGFVSSKESGIQWLDSVCVDLHRLFRILHKFLVFDGSETVSTVETSFLCISQIVTCVRCLERTLLVEAKRQCVLSSTRQCFLDRIIWCLSRVKSVVESETPVESVTETNFVSFLDLVLSLVNPLTVSVDETSTVANRAATDAEAMIECKRIRSVVEALISQAFAFGNVLPDEDRQLITICCQKVLKECIDLEREASFDEDTPPPNIHNRKLQASMLESAIYKLETRVNECLLRLVYNTFGSVDETILQRLKDRIETGASEEDIEETVNEFDSFIDRMMQIGLFAISYADNLKTSSAIRSCLASLEALDSYLIPSMYLPTNGNTAMLEAHWLDESKSLHAYVHQIIDTNAFALALLELLDNGIDSLEQDYDPDTARVLVQQADIFRQHMEIVDLDLDTIKQASDDYTKMILECRAIIECAVEDRSILQARIIKRFRVLLVKLRKIQMEIAARKGIQATNTADEQLPMFDGSNEQRQIEETVRELFNETERNPPVSCTGILYRSRAKTGTVRSKREITSLLEINSFTDILEQRRKYTEQSPEETLRKLLVPGSSKRKTIRRNSLRVAMFKRQQCHQTAEFYESIKSDFDLQITEILDQLTDLSNTFSAPLEPKPCESIVPVASISIAGSNAHIATPLEEQQSEPIVPMTPITIPRKSITKEEIAILDDNKIRINIMTNI